ncbi:polyadenylate-binding protein-interacting protein 1-like [Saccoglossus kowalevskii]|uniref:Polyadenylate-binding protein-interacting protein 1-like n=1 Tax=Saccoglossus kowalevskii TaxID=10224 RepID=A0ABM0H0S0_SACKO|nr:PREDICTED: polyadenylate-binding protein-interacting protein 1-like [Saccoglossus kowalevskii]
MSLNIDEKLGDKGGGSSRDPAAGDSSQRDAYTRKPLRSPKPGIDADYRTPPPAQGTYSQSSQSWSQTVQTAANSMSSLSVNAPVFVPMGYSTATTPQQNFVGYNEFEGLKTNRPAILSVSKNENDETRLLKDSMFKLMSSPASFDDLLKTLTSKFNQSVRDEKSLLEIIRIIYELSVEQVNFRYTGARMCNYLSRHMNVETDSGTFRQHLLKRLHQEFEKKDESIRNPQTIPRLLGFTLFVAELFENFEIIVNDQPERLHVLREALGDLSLTLLSHPQDGNIKCVINVLKLTGSNLEHCERKKTGSSKYMDAIFVKVNELSTSDKINISIREMLMKLLLLRAVGWNRDEETPKAEPPAQAASAPAQEFSNEPIFFAPDGRQISAQEAGFYNYDEYDEEYYGNDYEVDYQQWSNEDDEYYENAIVLDEEACADYEQFLRETTGGYS